MSLIYEILMSISPNKKQPPLAREKWENVAISWQTEVMLHKVPPVHILTLNSSYCYNTKNQYKVLCLEKLKWERPKALGVIFITTTLLKSWIWK